MKLKYYFLLVIIALFTSCSNELGMQDNLNDSKILLSSDRLSNLFWTLIQQDYRLEIIM